MGVIAHLPQSLIGHLRSSSVLSDIAQAVEELICNSVDAGAKKVRASVDLASFYIRVEDDGFGITREDLTLVGGRHATSKLHDLKDLETGITTLGFRGEALSSLSDISILEITTRVRGSPNTYKKIVKGCKKLSMGLCSEQRAPGTTVAVRDLFHNLPVRRKVIQSSPRKVLQAIQDRALRLALIHPDVSFTVTDLERQEDLIDTKSCVSPLDTLSEVFGEWLHHELQELNYSQKNFQLYGFVSKDASKLPSKAIQFFYLNRRFVHKTPVHKLINTYFSVNSSCNEMDMSLERIPMHETKSWMVDAPSRQSFPAFLLDLHCSLSSYDITFETTKTSVEFKDWGPVISFVKEALGTVWRRSTKNLSEGKKDLSEERAGTSSKSSTRKRKLWQLFDQTYHPRCKTERSTACINHASFADYRVQDSDLDSGDKVQEPIKNTLKRSRSARKKRDYSPTFRADSSNELPTAAWDMQHCVQKESRHVTRSTISSRSEQTRMQDDNLWKHNDDHGVAWDIVKGDSVIPFEQSHSRLFEGVLDCKKPYDNVKELELEDELSLSVFSRASIKSSPVHSHRSTMHTTEDIFWDRPSNQLPTAKSTSLVDFDGDGLAAVEFAQTPSPFRKTNLIPSHNVRRCLYYLNLKPSHKDNFLCHSERQTVSNLDVGERRDLLEIFGSSGSSRNRICDWMCGSQTPEWDLPICSPNGSHAEGFERNLELDGYNINTKYGASLNSRQSLHQFPCSDPTSQTLCKGVDLLNSRSTLVKSYLKNDLEEDGDICSRGQPWKHIPSMKIQQEPAKNKLQRSLSGPPFYRPLKRHALYVASTPSCFRMSEERKNSQKACPEAVDKEGNLATPGKDHQQSSAAALGCDLIIQKRTFQEAPMAQQEELKDLLPVDRKCRSSSLEDSNCDANNSKWREHPSDDNQVSLTAIDLYRDWRNPCMRQNEREILDLSSGFLGPTNKYLLPESISKEKLQKAQVLQQLGKKLIAIVAQDVLVVVDQHAADERIRLEQLRKEVLWENKKQSSTFLDYPQELSITVQDQQLLHTYRSQIEGWGWRFKVVSEGKACFDRSSFGRNGSSQRANSVALLTAVPRILGESLNDKNYLAEYLRQLAMTDGTSTPPPAVLRVLASKACRGAIMFGDFLLKSESQQLVEGLKQTALCFQCAHGRPTLVPLVNLEALHRRLGKLHCKVGGPSETLCDPVSVNQVEKNIGATQNAVVWHGLQWHRVSLERAQTRLKHAEEM